MRRAAGPWPGERAGGAPHGAARRRASLELPEAAPYVRAGPGHADDEWT